MSVFLDAFFVLFIAFGLLFYSGWGLAILLTPQKLQSWVYILLPFLGLFLIDSLTHLTLYADIPGYRAIWLLFVVATVINVLAFIFKRTNWRWPSRFEATIFLVAVPAIILVLVPMFVQGELLAIGTNNNADPISHTATTDWLRQHAFSENIPQDSKYPVNVPIQRKVKTDVRLGYHFFQMYVDLLAGRQAYSTFSIVAAVSFYLWSVAIGFFAGTVLQLKNAPVFLSVLLFSLSSLPLWIAFGGYGPQILGMGLMIMALAWWILALQRFDWRAVVFAAAFSSAFAGIYSDVLPYLIAPIGLLFLTLLVQNIKDAHRIRQIIGTSIFAVTLTLVFNLFGWYRAISRSAFVAAKPSPGNVDRWIDIRQVFGLTHFHYDRNISFVDSSVEYVLLSLVQLFLLCFICYGFFKLSRQSKIITLCFVLPHLGSLIWFFNKHHYYLYFKGWSVGLFIYVILMAVGIYSAFGKIKSKERYVRLAYLGFAFLLFILIRSSINQIIYVEQQLAMTPDIIEIGRWVEDIDAGENIYIAPGEHSRVSVFWIAYFLTGHPISYDRPIVYTTYQGSFYQFEPWIIRDKKVLPFWDETLWDEEILRENDTFVLSTLDWKNRDYTIPEMQYPLHANVNDQYHLLGFDLEIDSEQVEKSLNLTLYWQVDKHAEQDYKNFVHLVDQDGNLIQQIDSYPYNSAYHTSYWQPGEIVQGSYELILDKDLSPGIYALKVGWYFEETGERLSVEQNGKLADDSSIVIIESIEIEE